MIRGWAMYHRHIVAKQTFAKIDHDITMMLWRWAKRRHNHGDKTKMWIKKRYFTRNKGKDWVFFDVDEQTKASKEKVTLFSAAAIPIKRHVKIDANANPYTPRTLFWAQIRTKNGWKVWRTTVIIFANGKKAAFCGQAITPQTGWQMHHIEPRHLGKLRW
jgi:RNA-directed DNA polymerase